MQARGFSLLELLLVLAVIGIVAAALYVNLNRFLRAAELREAATQVVTDLGRARSSAQRGGQSMPIVLPGDTGGTTYRVGSSDYTVPHNVLLICKSGCSGPLTTFTYAAPYSELDSATGKIMTVQSPATSVSPLEIRIVGVTGKVILTKGTP